MVNEIAEFKVRRSSIKGSQTRIKKYVESNHTTMTEFDAATRLDLLESYFQQFMDVQFNIERLDVDELMKDDRDNYVETYCAIKSQLLALKSKLLRTSLLPDQHASILNVTQSRPPSSRLPKLSLPSFSGKYTEWQDFYKAFTILVHNDEQLTPIEKFAHLKNCLRESAINTIKALEMTETNYEEALKLLCTRYDNKRIIFQAHVKAIHEIKNISRSSESLRNLIDVVNANVRALKSLGSHEEIANAFLLFVVASKLDVLTISKWEEDAATDRLPTWADLETCLTRRCHALENKEYNLESTSIKPNPKPSTSRTSVRTTTLSTTVCNNSAQKCVVCGDEHDVIRCQKFNLMTVSERFDEAKKIQLCINCLRPGHRVRFCRSRRCGKCHQRHHTLLHREGEAAQGSEVKHVEKNSDSQTTLHSSLNPGDSSFKSNSPSVILATAVVNVRDRYGEIVKCRVILDSASQLNFISDCLAQILRIERTKTNVTINGLNDIETRVKNKVFVKLESRVNNYMTELEMLVVPKISSDQPNRKIDVADWRIPSGIELADPNFNTPGRVDILLGAGIFYELMGSKHVKLSNELPSLHQTELGWIIAGKVLLNDRNYVFSNTVEQIHTDSEEDTDLGDILERFWKVEGVGMAKEKQWSKEEEDCEQHFVDTVKRDPTGRFIVELPLKKVRTLGDSFWAAKTRFLNLERKLHRNPELLSQYKLFLSEYEHLNHMQNIIESDRSKCVYFMPHHCVLKPESTSTKLRVVFDASSKSSSGESLNSITKVGPTIQRDLFSIILRFRSHRYALTADITKMYRQVSITEPQTYLQCILWRNDPAEPIKMFRLKTVTYGTAPASFLVIRCLHQLAKQNSFRSLGSKCLFEDFYVDDMLSGAETIEQAIQLRKEVTEILKSGCFELRKWSANDCRLIEDVSIEDRGNLVSIETDDSVKTLGLSWHPKDDEFRYEYKPKPLTGVITKRNVLSDIATLFDPLGLVNPVIVSAKVFMQHLWRLKISWDSPLPEPYLSEWIKFRNQLPLVSSLVFPRFFRAPELHIVELHGFSDASTVAYGCCIYMRSISPVNGATCRLVCAKSRVAPIKALSLPRLELCAAELLAHLISRVISELNMEFDRVFCWTDSEIVLCWLAAHPSNWSAFVSNRVSTIQQLTDKFSWKHVDTKNNPADLVSRGSSPAKLSKISMWSQGPEFLQRDVSCWPPQRQNHEFNDAVERKKTNIVMHSTTKENVVSRCKFVNSFFKLRRVFAYVIRFIDVHILKRKRDSNDDIFTPDELSRATKFIVRITQGTAFHEEIRRLQQNKLVSNSSSLKFLSPFIDEEGIIRVGGRLHRADLAYDVTHPMLLPNYTPFVFSLFEHFHFRNMHAGPQALLSAVRQQFWVIRGRDVARQVVHKCITCFRWRPRLYQQVMGSLPSDRVKPDRAFRKSGVDFCGPVWIHYKTRGKTPTKAYIAVFVCFTSKAVHLEVVSDLSANTFFAAFKRFVGRRGPCESLYCDNATNFVGCRRQMKEFREQFLSTETRDHIKKSCAEDNTNFIHIPPRSPHFGGLWEAAVKSAKHHLNRCLDGSTFTYEELETVIVQIEAILNSRPIIPMSSDPGDLSALTPGHFIIGGPLTAPIEPDLTDLKFGRLDRYQKIRQMQQKFWERWSREYITQLQHRAKWRSSININLGTMVLVSDDNVPPQKWVLGRITKLHPGEDGHTRVVTVQTPHGTLRRAVNKLAPLPIEDEMV